MVLSARVAPETIARVKEIAARRGKSVDETVDLVLGTLGEDLQGLDDELKVLVVEDDPITAELMDVRLASLGCRCLIATTADEAMKLAADQHPDMVLLDLKLHGSLDGGTGVLTSLRESEATRDIPVVAHSVFANDRAELPSGADGVDAVLAKPGRRDALLDLVTAIRLIKRSAAVFLPPALDAGMPRPA